MHPVAFQHRYQYDSAREGIFLPVELKLGNQAVVIEAAVDTGASYCVFAPSVAESLGLDLESGLPQLFTSPAGHIETFGHSVHLNILGIEVDAMVFFLADGNIHKNLLGRRGWLDRVKFGLDEYHQIVYFSGSESHES